MARTRRFLRFGCTLVGLLCLHACSGVQTRALIDNPPEHLPVSSEITDVPFFPQTQHQCGPAALATVLAFNGVDTTPEQLASRVYLPEPEGSLQIEMAAAARAHGMLVYPLKPHMADLLAEVAAGNPVVVLQNNGFDWLPQWHYAVVAGYDFSGRKIILRSGETRRYITTFNTFETTWQRSDYWALVILPAGRVAATAQLTSYLKAAYALEQTGLSQAALQAYRAATTTWPSAFTAWLALGNLTYQLRALDESVSAFMQAAAIEPGNALVWNNLAYTLQAYGCNDEARKAIGCARNLEADNKNIQHSENDIQSTPASASTRSCPVISC